MSLTSTERKRAWRLRHPEASQTAERQRAQARRDGYWGRVFIEDGMEVRGRDLNRPCQSGDSYWRYENTIQRMKQRWFWPRYGAGTTKMTREEFQAAGSAILGTRQAAMMSEAASAMDEMEQRDAESDDAYLKRLQDAHAALLAQMEAGVLPTL